jgi:hypothetical protein
MMQPGYPVEFTVDYPDRPLDRLTTAFRIFTVIPIAIVLAVVAGGTWQSNGRAGSMAVAAGAAGLLFLGPLLMILFRQKYPSTDEEQSVHLDFPYPDVPRDLNRWLPLVKWFLAIPHFVALFFLSIAAFVAVVVAWFAILFTGRYPRPLFDFVGGVIRWSNRVTGYALILVTDQYPPFRLAA